MIVQFCHQVTIFFCAPACLRWGRARPGTQDGHLGPGRAGPESLLSCPLLWAKESHGMSASQTVISVFNLEKVRFLEKHVSGPRPDQGTRFQGLWPEGLKGAPTP